LGVADIDPAFVKAFNAGDLDTLLKLYDDQSILVAEPGKPVQGLENIKKALMGFLALKLPIQLTVRRVYENGDVGLCVADWSMAGKGPDGKDVKLGGTSAEVVKKLRAATGYTLSIVHTERLSRLASRRQCRLQLLAQATHYLCVQRPPSAVARLN
jgi:ketosteroid isomerase-like protein